MILKVTLPPLKDIAKAEKRELALHELANKIAAKHYLTGYELKIKKRKAVLVAARVDFAKAAIKTFTQEEVADFLGVHSSTVCHYLNDYQDRPAKNQGSRSGHAKLSENDIPEIRQMYQGGSSQKKIAEIFSVTQRTINNIVNKETWSHV